MRDSTIIYRSFYEAISKLTDAEQGKVWRAVFEYSFNGNVVELEGVLAMCFTFVKPQLDANIQRYKNGLKAKQKQTGSKRKAKHKRVTSKPEANKNQNVNENGNVNSNLPVHLNPNLNYHHSSDQFFEVWSILVKEKKWKRKSDNALQMALDKLATVNEQDAIKMMRNTIAGEWQGIFDLKENEKTPGLGRERVYGKVTVSDIERQQLELKALDDAEQRGNQIH